MLLSPHILLALGLYASRASCNYVQTKPCEDTVSKPGIYYSLSAFYQPHGDGDNTLRLDVIEEGADITCDAVSGNSTTFLALHSLGHRWEDDDQGPATCRSWSSPMGSREESLVYSITENLGFVSPLSTFDFRLELEPSVSPGAHVCLRGEFTPAMADSTSKALTWVPRALFIFMLLVGVLRGIDENNNFHVDGPVAHASADLSLPGVGEFLGYLQFVFLSGSLSLHYPGFFQPVASKLSLFSLFLRGPFTHGAVYPSVGDGIYSINGTFGGTTGLEHMHQIVGAPKTSDTWLNMAIAVLIVSCTAAFFLELVSACMRFVTDRGPARFHPSSTGIVPRLLALLRLVLSYFTLPLSALSFYQLSAAEYLPAYNTASATLLIVSTILAFVWLFRRMPAQRAGLLIFDIPKWYQQQHGHSAQPRDPGAEKMLVTTIVVMTFVRGAAIGGLQISGPVQLSILAASELFFLILIRWLRIYPVLSMGTITPAVRLLAILLMAFFVRDASSLSARSAIGYAIILLHALMVIFGLFIPAIYHLAKICLRMFQDHRHDKGYSATGSASVAPIVPLSIFPQRSTHRDDQSTDTSSSSGNILSPSNSQNNSQGTRPKQHEFQYFRQPRHSSYRSSYRDTKSAGSTVEPPHSSGASRPQTPSRTTSSAASESVEFVGSPSSSSRGESVDDAWNDTRSVPLGPRWNDYTYREGDAFYTVLPTPEAVLPSRVATAGAPRSQNGMLESLRSMFGTTFHSTAKTPESSGFSVSRPSRPQPVEADETGVGSHSDDDATRSLV